MSKIWVIPDLHGAHEFLKKALEFIGPLEKDDLLIFLGDYVDRGPHSFEVIEEIISVQEKYPEQVITLKGNHEDFLIKSFNYEEKFIPANIQQANFNMWIGNGGMATIHNYLDRMEDDSNFTLDRVSLKPIFPRKHIDFLIGLQNYFIVDNYWFVHGGCNPEVNPRHQNPEILLWDRSLVKTVKLFLELKKIGLENESPKIDWEPMIICGHSGPNPVYIPNKYLMLDGGCPRQLIFAELKSGNFWQIEPDQEIKEFEP